MSFNNNNTAETIVKGSAFQEKVWEGDNYPDPNTLPLPSQEQRISDVTLSELIPERYVSTTSKDYFCLKFSAKEKTIQL